VDTGGAEVGARRKGYDHVPRLGEEGNHVTLHVGAGSFGREEITGDCVVTPCDEGITDTTAVLTGYEDSHSAFSLG